MNDNSLNLQNICRICLEEKIKHVFISDGVNLSDQFITYSEMLRECASVNIDETDSSSKQLCLICVQDLRKFYDFREKCKSSDQKIKQLQNEIKYPSTLNYDPIETYDPLPDFELGFEDTDHENPKSPVSVENIEPKQDDFKFSCEDCDEKFKFKKDLARHAVLKHAKTQHKCKICNKVYLYSWGLTQHMLTHGFNCKRCFEEFESEEKMQEHLKLHGENQDLCHLCQKSFTNTRKLRFHIRTHTGEKPYLCTFCGLSFSNNANHIRHLYIHKGLKPYVCKTCGAAFNQAGTLQIHMVKHTGVKDQVCEICSKSYGRKNDLKRHMLTHNAEKNIICPVCGTGFSSQNNLLRHLKIHSNEDPPFKCSVCSKKFGKTYQLKMHMLSHSGEKPHICTTCGKGFSQKHALVAHQNRHLKP